MAGNWNPLAPAGLGLEWEATREYLMPVAKSVAPFGQRLRSTAAQTVTGLRMRATVDSAVSQPLMTLVDVYPEASIIAGAVTTAYYLPSGDITAGSDIGAGDWERVGGATTNLYLSIDDMPSVPPADSDYIGVNNGIGTPSGYNVHVGSGAHPLTSRILRLSIVAVHKTNPSPDNGNLPFQYRLWYVPTTTTYTPPNAAFSVNAYGGMVTIDCGEINPVTMLPWSPADVREFAVGGDWGLRVESVGNANTNPIVWAMALKVEYVTENRAAIGTWERDPAVGDYVDTDALVSLNTGTGVLAANWAKPSSGDFVYVWRAAHAPMVTGSDVLADDVLWHAAGADLAPVLDAQYPPVSGMAGAVVPVSETGRVASAFAGDLKRAAVLGIEISGPAFSDDSQPYELGLAQLLGVTSADANGVAQRLRQSSGGPLSYLGVRFLVVPPATGSTTLTVTVNRVSDGVQMGGSLVLTAAAVRALTSLGGTDAKRVEGFLSSGATLVSGTQYELRFVASGSDVWYLLAPESHTSLAGNTYAGSTDSAREGGSTYTDRDIEAVLLVQPSAPAGFGAAVDPEDLYAEPAHGCRPRSYNVVDLTWTPTALGSAFLRYEVERQDPDTSAWHLVATIDTEATATWSDEEMPRNRGVSYRLRVIATTLAFSDWATAGPVIAETEGAELILTSNHRPDLRVVMNYDPDAAFDFPDGDADELYPIHGGDGYLVFSDPEDRGVATQYRMVVFHADASKVRPSDGAGNLIGHKAMWEPLRRITRALFRDDGSGTIPYVAVCDLYGNVTYAYVKLGTGRNRQPADRYHVDLTATPLQAYPTPTDV